MGRGGSCCGGPSGAYTYAGDPRAGARCGGVPLFPLLPLLAAPPPRGGAPGRGCTDCPCVLLFAVAWAGALAAASAALRHGDPRRLLSHLHSAPCSSKRLLCLGHLCGAGAAPVGWPAPSDDPDARLGRWQHRDWHRNTLLWAPVLPPAAGGGLLDWDPADAAAALPGVRDVGKGAGA
eukprot:gene51395-58492_t